MILHKNDVENLILPESPRVYIYSSHFNEGYASSNLENYNITPNVVMAGRLLKEKLNKLNVPTIVEEGDIGGFMAVNNWNFNRSYEASRYFVEDALKNNSTLELLIDLHRDAIPKSTSTVDIDGTSYAKILFVCGKENPNYEQNMALMNKINDKVKEKLNTVKDRIAYLRKEINKTLNEEAGTETEIDINEQYIECLEIELERLEITKRILEELL